MAVRLRRIRSHHHTTDEAVKRSPIQRRTRMRFVSDMQKKRQMQLNISRRLIVARSHNFCESGRYCGHTGEHAHHVVRRSQGGSNGIENLLWLCHQCHEWIHTHVAEARELGLLASKVAPGRGVSPPRPDQGVLPEGSSAVPLPQSGDADPLGDLFMTIACSDDPGGLAS